MQPLKKDFHSANIYIKYKNYIQKQYSYSYCNLFMLANKCGTWKLHLFNKIKLNTLMDIF